MLNKAIADDIKQTGWAIRDWLAPFYSLGASVAFCITLLTLLDQDGKLYLTRIVGTILVLCTLVAWASHLYKQHTHRNQGAPAAQPPKAKLHLILLTVSGFFIVGILFSEAWMETRRLAAAAEQAPAETPAPAQVKELAPVEAAAASSAPPSTPSALPTTTAAVEAPPTTPSQPAALLPEPPLASTPATERSTAARNAKQPLAISPTTPVERAKKAPVLAGSTTAAANSAAISAKAPRQAASADSAACASLLNKFSLGEEISAQEQSYLETSCR